MAAIHQPLQEARRFRCEIAHADSQSPTFELR
jgi:hypothetical protein